VVVKSQILAGGRGLGTFTNGLKGGVHIAPKARALELAAKMLGGTLVTKQTGPAGAAPGVKTHRQLDIPMEARPHPGWPAMGAAATTRVTCPT
ncbi:Succinyl-CoA ligase [ADP-forming] subunit beta, mitochondrial, partial [Tetrabaena socialis]